jgi:formylglycine-generating enzyme required for sulfatase activity
MSRKDVHGESRIASTARPAESQSAEPVRGSVDLSIPGSSVQGAGAPKVPGYVLTRLLGDGAHGQVWRALQIRTRNEVAVKVFTQRSGLDWIFLQREVERLTRLDRHPHIVTLLDAGLDADPPFYATELLGGGSLDRFVKPLERAPVGRVVRWMAQICDAIAYVHGKGLIHCDLKPANILVDEQDNIRIVDFGQSRVFTESTALDTLFYMAPEQAVLTEPDRPVPPDVRWDVFAFGATCFAMITGSVPWSEPRFEPPLYGVSGLENHLAAYRAAVQGHSPAEQERLLAQRVGRDLAAVVVKSMAPKAAERYESAAQIQADLQAIREHRPVSPLAGNAGYRARRFIGRNPWGIALAAAFLVLAGSLLFVRTQRIRLARAEAQALATAFVEQPAEALSHFNRSGDRVKELLREYSGRCVSSPAFTERIVGARSALWANPKAFWESVNGGALWVNGEWLEVCRAGWGDPAPVLAQLGRRAVGGTDRQKYVAFCLMGQIARGNSALAELCAKAVEAESDPGVVVAARWAAMKLGRDVSYRPSERIFVDDVARMTFVLLPPCEAFRRGSPADEADRYDNEEQAKAPVAIGPLYVATTEVTAGAFAAFFEDPASAGLFGRVPGGSPEATELRKRAGAEIQSQIARKASDEAVMWVSLDAARRYCEWLTARAAAASPQRRYRLATEDEWEYACRGGNTGRFCFGNDAEYARFFAICQGDSPQGPVVAQRMPNAYGLFDMHGGLWEWCESRFPAEFVKDPRMPAEAAKNLYVLRGGASYSPAVRCRSAQRNYADPHSPGMHRGFRIVMEPVNK